MLEFFIFVVKLVWFILLWGIIWFKIVGKFFECDWCVYCLRCDDWYGFKKGFEVVFGWCGFSSVFVVFMSCRIFWCGIFSSLDFILFF